jgi:hypothetical protein
MRRLLLFALAVSLFGQRQDITVPVGAASANLRFERLMDPIERAFTIEAPAGWRSVVALARTGMVQVNPYLRSLSPDKMTYVLFGDPTFPTFTVPNQMRNTIGLREGSATYDSVGGRGQIRRYQPGAEFARSYGQTALGGLCSGLKPAGSRDLPDLARKIEQLDRNVIPTRYDAGEADFTCTHNRQEMAAYAAAVTWITRDQIGMWVVRGFVGFITPKDQAGQAKGILQHIVDSLTWEPAWNQQQSELSRQAGEIVKKRIAMFERQQAAFNAKLNGIDQSFQDMDDIINGRGQYYDPRTGKHYDLSNTGPVKWLSDDGRIVGTSGQSPPPGLDWRQLTPGKGQ